MNDSPVQVVLLTGYLGAGKSTLLKHLLGLPEIMQLQPALIVNEFGKEGVDGRLFDGAGCPLFEINRGSLFCICTKADLLEALTEIDQIGPGVLLVEATGVAETRDIESLMDEPHLAGRFVVRSNLCVVDALNFTKVAPFLKAARNQVAAADGIVVNKMDLATSQTLAPLAELLRKMNPRAAQVQATRCNIEYSFLESLTHQRTEASLAIAQPEAVFAQSFKVPGPVDRAAFGEAVQRLGNQLLRLKGHLLFYGESQPVFVETVCGSLSFGRPLSDRAELGFTAIAFGLPEGHLQRTFEPLFLA